MPPGSETLHQHAKTINTIYKYTCNLQPASFNHMQTCLTAKRPTYRSHAQAAALTQHKVAAPQTAGIWHVYEKLRTGLWSITPFHVALSAVVSARAATDVYVARPEQAITAVDAASCSREHLYPTEGLQNLRRRTLLLDRCFLNFIMHSGGHEVHDVGKKMAMPWKLLQRLSCMWRVLARAGKLKCQAITQVRLHSRLERQRCPLCRAKPREV